MYTVRDITYPIRNKLNNTWTSLYAVDYHDIKL